MTARMTTTDAAIAAAAPPSAAEHARSDAVGQRHVRVEMFLVGGDPVGRDLFLGDGDVDLTGADLAMKLVFELVLDVRVPGLCLETFGPQVLDQVAAAQLQ